MKDYLFANASNALYPHERKVSKNPKTKAKIKVKVSTTIESLTACARVGQLIRWSSLIAP